MADSDPDRSDSWIKGLVLPLEAELTERLSDRTLEALKDGRGEFVALSTALVKAFMSGQHYTQVVLAAQLIEHGAEVASPPALDVELARADAWANDYGDTVG